jgi:molybdopterin molybdotransferase
MPLDEAQALLLGSVDPLPAEIVLLADASGRYLAEPLHARRSQPPADLSAMDGYAMRADDLAGPWRVTGESAAGHPFGGALRSGEAVRISTGAHMPKGPMAVLLQENVRRVGDMLSLVSADGPTTRHIRRHGFDFAEGDMLLPAGVRLNPARLALAITGGHARARVGTLPRVAIIDSGDELASNPEQVAGHQMPASNGAMLAAMAAPLAARVERIGPVPDRLDALVMAFEAAGPADVIVTSGGASVGDHDLIRPALEAWGATIDFWRIAMKPGKPLLVARKGGTVILGLPGNPVSSHVTAFLFLLPLLRRLAGASEPLPPSLVLPLSVVLPAVGNRTEFVRATLGNTGLAPVTEQDSSALVALSKAQVLIRREMHAPPAPAGTLLPVYLLENGGNA